MKRSIARLVILAGTFLITGMTFFSTPETCLAANEKSDTIPDSLRYPIKDIRLNVSNLSPGKVTVLLWGSYPVWVIKRTKEDITNLEKTDLSILGDPGGKNLIASFVKAYDVDPELPNLLALDQSRLEQIPLRSYHDDVFVFLNFSPYSGCVISYKPVNEKPTSRLQWHGGFYDPCSDQTYDLAGRVFKEHTELPQWNLYVPPHRYLDKNTLLIGLGSPPRKIAVKNYSPKIDYPALSPTTRLIQAAKYGRLDIVKNSVAEGGSVNANDETGNNALSLAALKGHYDVAAYLLGQGASAVEPDKRGMTPLHASILGFNYRIAKLLIQKGANVNQICTDPSCNGNGTPLNIAILSMNRRGDVATMIKLLLQADADPYLKFQGMNAFDAARETGQGEVLTMLQTKRPINR